MRRMLYLSALVGVPLALLAGPVWGAEGAETGGGGENPVTVNYWQAAYAVAVFGCLLAILAKFAFKPIVASLKKREDFIRQSLEDAQKNREQAEARLKEYEAKLVQAGQEATAILDQGRRDADVARRHIEEEAKRNGDALIERARHEINLARDAALKSLFDQSADMAASLAASALKRQMSPEEHQRLVMDALRELQERERAAN